MLVRNVFKKNVASEKDRNKQNGLRGRQCYVAKKMNFQIISMLIKAKVIQIKTLSKINKMYLSEVPSRLFLQTIPRLYFMLSFADPWDFQLKSLLQIVMLFEAISYFDMRSHVARCMSLVASLFTPSFRHCFITISLD